MLSQKYAIDGLERNQRKYNLRYQYSCLAFKQRSCIYSEEAGLGLRTPHCPGSRLLGPIEVGILEVLRGGEKDSGPQTLPGRALVFCIYRALHILTCELARTQAGWIPSYMIIGDR